MVCVVLYTCTLRKGTTSFFHGIINLYGTCTIDGAFWDNLFGVAPYFISHKKYVLKRECLT